MVSLPLFFLAIGLLLCRSTHAINHTDHLALLAIKSVITHDPQHVLDSWNTSLHFCKWQGVTCGYRHQRVAKLDLMSRGVIGSLSPHIGNLSFLRILNLGNNTFKGVIPSQIGGLFKLEKLILLNNSFEGEVPTSLSNCTRLVEISLGYNKLSGRLPEQLSLLVNLVNISIHNNDFTGGIPSFFANLSSLEIISASNNRFGGSIPQPLGQLHNLRVIAFDNCEVYGEIPSSIYNLTSLVVLSLLNNRISGDLPKDIGLRLSNLTFFQIGRNEFTGTIPFSFSNCSKMAYLDLGENFFTGKVNVNFRYMQDLRGLRLFANDLGSSQPDEMRFIDSLTNCSKLEELFFQLNQFGGVLPSSIGNLSSQLIILSMRGNFINGSLPPGIGNLVKLEWLNLQQNQFTGIIPNELGNLRNLQRLHLFDNKFNGNIPDFLGNLSLFELGMRNNRFEGQIPPNLGKSKNLRFLDLSENDLTGPIPVELFQLSSLSIILNLSQNHLVGSLPKEIGKLTSLTKLDLSKNDLDGRIPGDIGSCASLEYLYLDRNSFQGLVPSSMSALRGIKVLYLSSNNFSGGIPRFLEQLNLSSLNLSFNNFYGEVPIGGIFKNASAFKIDGNIRLCGGLPKLGLPKCAMPTRSKKDSRISRVILVVMLPCLFFVVAVIFFLRFCLRRSRIKQAQQTETSLMQPFSRISYGSILKATNGFSQQNLIGTGAFSVVYKGLFEPDGAMVAIKVLNLGNKGALRSFMMECEALKNIRHRNLVRILTSCSSVDFQGNDFKALIYEYMPNGNLDRWLHPSSEQDIKNEVVLERLSLYQRLKILIDVAHAIHYLHHDSEVPIIHCDLKPSNILLDNDMVAHVSDFGIAKLLKLKPNESSSIGIRGTIGYVAPEHCLGSEMTKEGDIYSFGILLLEMMTGKRPTDRIFEEGLNLHGYVKMAFPDRLRTVVDPTILSIHKEETDAANCKHGYIENGSKKWKRLDEVIISLGRIGLACSMESPKDRIDANKIIHELSHISGILNSGLS